jgi:hypothetical protein
LHDAVGSESVVVRGEAYKGIALIFKIEFN